jgi:amidase
VQPAARAALYAMKLTIGSSELDGVYSVSGEFDSGGAMAKSVQDLAMITEHLLNDSAHAKLPSSGFAQSIRQDFDGLSIGFVDFDKWL